MTNESGHSEPRIVVDEDWKSKVEAEREQLRQMEATKGSGAAESPNAPDASAQADRSPEMRLPPASFLTLVETLAMQAMASLGELVKPQDASRPAEEVANEKQFHREMAKHLIDSLAVLETKTKGNLEPEEAQHLDSVLHELRMAWIKLKA